jgi:hypothetical protein
MLRFNSSAQIFSPVCIIWYFLNSHPHKSQIMWCKITKIVNCSSVESVLRSFRFSWGKSDSRNPLAQRFQTFPATIQHWRSKLKFIFAKTKIFLFYRHDLKRQEERMTKYAKLDYKKYFDPKSKALEEKRINLAKAIEFITITVYMTKYSESKRNMRKYKTITNWIKSCWNF